MQKESFFAPTLFVQKIPHQVSVHHELISREERKKKS